MVLDPIPQILPVHFFGSRPQPPTSRMRATERLRERDRGRDREGVTERERQRGRDREGETERNRARDRTTHTKGLQKRPIWGLQKRPIQGSTKETYIPRNRARDETTHKHTQTQTRTHSVCVCGRESEGGREQRERDFEQNELRERQYLKGMSTQNGVQKRPK